MANKKKFYVVWEGHETGIFDNWSECQANIKGYPGAKYKSFNTLAEAKDAYNENYYKHIQRNKTSKPSQPQSSRSDILKNTWSVDAACSGNPGKMEYRGVLTDTGQEIFRQGPFEEGTNNIGEFLAIVHALALLKMKNDPSKVIYTDSKTAISWVKNKNVKTLLQKNEKNAILFELIDRALNWLKQNKFENQIIKWDTKSWGEIPADFGRK